MPSQLESEHYSMLLFRKYKNDILHKLGKYKPNAWAFKAELVGQESITHTQRDYESLEQTIAQYELFTDRGAHVILRRFESWNRDLTPPRNPVYSSYSSLDVFDSNQTDRLTLVIDAETVLRWGWSMDNKIRHLDKDAEYATNKILAGGSEPELELFFENLHESSHFAKPRAIREKIAMENEKVRKKLAQDEAQAKIAAQKAELESKKKRWIDKL